MDNQFPYFKGFTYKTAIPYEAGVTRRDPSPVVYVWPHGDGVAALMAPVGPEGSTLLYSNDGIHFSRVQPIDPPRAPGPYREDRWDDGIGVGANWGICQDVSTSSDWPFLLRFDGDLRAP